MQKFIVVEIGSTNTKAKLYDSGKIKDLGFKTIEFKDNFKKNKKILDTDKETLYSYLLEFKEETPNIYVYGTSIFRNLNSAAKELWLKEFKDKTGLDFNIVSSKDEKFYTCYGAYDKSYKDSIAIMIAGGASTELAIYNDRKCIEEQFYNFGATNATDLFPDLRSDIVSSNYNAMLDEIKKLVSSKPKNKADVLVLAGGDFIYFYEEAKYKLEKNIFYDNSNAPYMIDIKNLDLDDQKYFYKTSLNEISIRTNRESWWRGTRGMRLCVKVICDLLDVKYVVPTRINMIDGLIVEILERGKNENRI